MKTCERCGTSLNRTGFCKNEKCRFKHHKQGCQDGWAGAIRCPVQSPDCTCGGSPIKTDFGNAKISLYFDHTSGMPVSFEDAGTEILYALKGRGWRVEEVGSCGAQTYHAIVDVDRVSMITPEWLAEVREKVHQAAVKASQADAKHALAEEEDNNYEGFEEYKKTCLARDQAAKELLKDMKIVHQEGWIHHSGGRFDNTIFLEGAPTTHRYLRLEFEDDGARILKATLDGKAIATPAQ